MNKNLSFVFVILCLCAACKSSAPTYTATVPAQENPADLIEVILLQMNDVYELLPGKSDDLGGLARVATLRKQLLEKNPNVLTVLAGDFISPSVYSTTKLNGKGIKGLQIIEGFNALGVDLCVFGNHEFDYSRVSDLQRCLDASDFLWLGTNVRQNTENGQQPFFQKKNTGIKIMPDTIVYTFSNTAGAKMRLGLFGATLDVNPKKYVTVLNQYKRAIDYYKALQNTTDVAVGLTHQFIHEDSILSTKIPSVPLLMGGHEHEGHYKRIGKTVIAKAHSNAKSVYIHRLTFNTKTKLSKVISEEVMIDNSLPEDPKTAAVAAKWDDILMRSLRNQGFSPNEKVIDLTESINCTDAYLRSNQAKIGQWLTEAMYQASATKPDCVLSNSGSMRLDDKLDKAIYQFDLVKLLPYGGGFSEIEIRGSLLMRVLAAGEKNKTSGGYLQRNRCAFDAEKAQWTVEGAPIEAEKIYRLALPDFLLTGRERGIEFLKAELKADGTTTNPDILSITRPDSDDKADVRNDVRLTLIAYLKTL